jgi:hypothetical protein
MVEQWVLIVQTADSAAKQTIAYGPYDDEHGATGAMAEMKHNAELYPLDPSITVEYHICRLMNP